MLIYDDAISSRYRLRVRSSVVAESTLFLFGWGQGAPLRSIRTDGVMGPPTPRRGPARGSTSRLARANPRSLQTPTHNLPTPTCLDPQTNLRSPLSPSRPQSHFFSLPPSFLLFYFFLFSFPFFPFHSPVKGSREEKRRREAKPSPIRSDLQVFLLVREHFLEGEERRGAARCRRRTRSCSRRRRSCRGRSGSSIRTGRCGTTPISIWPHSATPSPIRRIRASKSSVSPDPVSIGFVLVYSGLFRVRFHLICGFLGRVDEW